MPSDKHRANTKVEDTDTGLLLEGHRYRLLGFGAFLTPDPLEYADGLNFYAYCGFNPWGRFDPMGLNSYLAVWFSKISYDENGNHYFDVGHAGYAVDNYRKESYTENVNGRTVNKTRMVPDGTVTYYDKWPFNSVDESDYANDVRADYSKGVVMSKDDFINMDPTGNREGNVNPEGRPADGIMEFNRTYSQDQSSKQYAEGEIKKNADYNGTFDQCSNFAQNGINSGARYGIDKINGRESIPIVGAILTPRVVTPNSLYNSALRGNNTRRIRGPETPVKSSYEVYRTKNDQISKNKTDKDDQ